MRPGSSGWKAAKHRPGPGGTLAAAVVAQRVDWSLRPEFAVDFRLRFAASRVNRVSEVLAVGDTPLDLQAGTNAGLRAVVGVLSGASTAENLRREPHTHILPSVANLPALLASKFRMVLVRSLSSAKEN